MSAWLRRRHPAFFALPVYLAMVMVTFANTPDDGLITLRYAVNLATAGRPDFNVGDHVEGFSSPLHLFVAAVAAAIVPVSVGGLALKLIGVAVGAAVIWQVVCLARACGLSRRQQIAAAALTALSWNLAVSASNALETSLVVLLVTGLLTSLLRPDRWHRPAWWAAALVVARPESALIVAALAAVDVALNRDRDWRSRLRWLVAPAGAVLGLLLFRTLYYGHFLPNTYSAKKTPLSSTLPAGFEYLLHSAPWWGLSTGLAAMSIAVTVVLGASAMLHWWRCERRLLLVPALIAVQLMIAVLSGGDWMVGSRHLAPAIPALTVCVVAGAGLVYRRLTLRRRLPDRMLATLVITAVLIGLAGPSRESYRPVWQLSGVTNVELIAATGYAGYRPLWLAAREMSSCLPAGSVLAFSEIGLFGIENLDKTVIDTRGLTNAEIAGSAPSAIKKGTGVDDPDWADPSSPVGAVLAASGPDLILALAADPAPTVLDETYELVATSARAPSGLVVAQYVPSGRTECR